MQSDQSHCKSLEYSMTVKLLTKQHLEFLSLKGGRAGWCESTLVKIDIVGNHMTWLKFNKQAPISVMVIAPIVLKRVLACIVKPHSHISRQPHLFRPKVMAWYYMHNKTSL